jgi:hypothetical protein
MTGTASSAVSQLIGAARKFVPRNGPRPLHGSIEAYVIKEFRILPAETSSLRYVTRPGSSGFIRVFDLTKAAEQGVTIKRFRDLDRHPDLVTCYGTAGRRGSVSLKREHRTATGEFRAQ